MKRYITILITLIATATTAQVKFTQMERAATKWNIPVAKRAVPGIPDYVMTYMTLGNLIDSTDTYFVSGVAPRIPYFSGTNKLYHSANMYWDSVNRQIFINNHSFGNGNSTVTSNLAIGQSALLNNTTGFSNTAIGFQSLIGNTTGGSNTGIGQNTLFSNTSGSGNTGIGFQSLYYNSSGGSNTGIGYYSLLNNTSGSGNVGIGLQSLFSNTTGSNSTATGLNSLYSNTSGANNTANGLYSLLSNTTGGSNTAVGTQALYSNTTANFNTAMGSNALYYNTVGGQNTAYGQNALLLNSTGSYNIGLGYQAGYSETGSNKLYIESSSSSTPLIGGDFATDRVGINTPIGSIDQTLNVSGTMRVTGSDGTATTIMGRDADGDVSAVTIGNGLTINTNTISSNINGTQNRVAKFTSQYAVGDSEIYTVGDTLVGINQSNPQYHLDVTGKFRVTNRTGTVATGAGFTSSGQLVSYDLDTGATTPNTYVTSGTSISITGAGTSGDPYVVNNTAAEDTKIKDSAHLDFSELTNDTITATIKTASVGATELSSTTVAPGSYTFSTITVDQDGRITSASSGSEGDGSSINEIQDLSLAGTVLSLSSDASTVNLSPFLDNVTTNLTFSGASSPVTLVSSDGSDVEYRSGNGILYSQGSNIMTIKTDTTSSTGVATQYDLTLKENTITPGTTLQYWRGDKTWQTLNTTVVPEGSNLYYTDARSRSAISLTTTGTSGAATYNSGTGVLNVPNYTVSGVTTLAAIGASPNANGATISGSTLNLQPASASFGGVITTGTQTIAGAKTFSYLGGPLVTNLTTGRSLVMADNNGKLENLYGTAAGYDLPLYNPTGNNWELTKLKTVNGNSLLGSGNVAVATNLTFTGVSSPFSLNSDTGSDVTFAAGSGVTLSRSSNELTIASSGMTSWNLAASGTAGSQSITNGSTATITAGSGITATRSGSNVTIAATAGTGTNLNFEPKSGTDVTLNSSSGADVIFRDGIGTSANRVAANVLKYDNTGVTSNVAGSGISVSGATGAVTITATGTAVGQMYTGGTTTVSFVTTNPQKVALTNAYTSGSGITVSDANDRITVGSTGKYMVTYSIDVDLNSTTAGFTALVRTGSGTTDIPASYKQFNNTTNLIPLSRTFYVDLSANENIELWISCSQAIAGNVLWDPILTIQRVQ